MVIRSIYPSPETNDESQIFWFDTEEQLLRNIADFEKQVKKYDLQLEFYAHKVNVTEVYQFGKMIKV